jgi:iron complex transport system substrate-binding protein
MLYSLGCGAQVVGVSHECDWPPACQTLPRVTRSRVDSLANSGQIDAAVKAMLSAGEALYEIDAARLIDLRPDLIVTQSQCDVCAVSYDDVVAMVRQTPQLATTEVLSLNPQSLDDVFQDMQRIGVAIGNGGLAAENVAALRQRVERIRELTAQLQTAQRPRVAIIEWLDPLMLAGNWVPQLLEIAGGQCPLTPRGQHSQYHSWDELLRWDPEAILICPCGFDLQRSVTDAKALKSQPGWKDLTAVKMQRVFVADGNACFNRPGPRLVETVELLAGLLHPKQFAIPAECNSLYCQFGK